MFECEVSIPSGRVDIDAGVLHACVTTEGELVGTHLEGCVVETQTDGATDIGTSIEVVERVDIDVEGALALVAPVPRGER